MKNISRFPLIITFLPISRMRLGQAVSARLGFGECCFPFVILMQNTSAISLFWRAHGFCLL